MFEITTPQPLIPKKRETTLVKVIPERYRPKTLRDLKPRDTVFLNGGGISFTDEQYCASRQAARAQARAAHGSFAKGCTLCCSTVDLVLYSRAYTSIVFEARLEDRPDTQATGHVAIRCRFRANQHIDWVIIPDRQSLDGCDEALTAYTDFQKFVHRKYSDDSGYLP